jgi:hypothetical protein
MVGIHGGGNTERIGNVCSYSSVPAFTAPLPRRIIPRPEREGREVYGEYRTRRLVLEASEQAGGVAALPLRGAEIHLGVRFSREIQSGDFQLRRRYADAASGVYRASLTRDLAWGPPSTTT